MLQGESHVIFVELNAAERRGLLCYHSDLTTSALFSGTDARDMLTGTTISVKLGIIGVKNRSAKETQDGKVG